MENFSTTQASNLSVFATGVVTLIAEIPKFAHPTLLEPNDIVITIMAIGAVIAAVISFFNRLKKGDLHLLGSRKVPKSLQ